MSSGRIVSYDEARRLARSHQWREKVLVYVTRGEDLLVLEHTADYPDAGVQVPAGGVDLGESPEAAATRELFEERGLTARVPPIYLQSCWWPNPDAPSRIRHYSLLAGNDDDESALDVYRTPETRALWQSLILRLLRAAGDHLEIWPALEKLPYS